MILSSRLDHQSIGHGAFTFGNIKLLLYLDNRLDLSFLPHYFNKSADMARCKVDLKWYFFLNASWGGENAHSLQRMSGSAKFQVLSSIVSSDSLGERVQDNA